MAYTTIKKPSDYFNTKLYTGNGTTDTAITGVGFQPDFFWGKSRTNNGSHFLVNIVSGVGKHLYSDTNSAETTFAEGVKSFDSDGFTIGTAGDINTNSQNYVAWNWKANGAGVANTDGSINSTVSVNTTAGFSIVSWTGNATAGATIGHGLGVAPSMLILKKTSASGTDWFVYHKSIGATHYLGLNQSYDKQDQILAWNDTAPTSSVFSVGSGGSSNGSGASMITYCFAEKQGFSKFGSYTGNGNADGTFVYTGFKPAMIITKQTNVAGGQWYIYDSVRNEFNLTDKQLFPNLSNAESTGNNQYDFYSNGFKARSSNGDTNASGGSYIYMAFAEEPLVGDNPATAR